MIARNRWLGPVVLAALAYATAGVVAAELAKAAGSVQLRTGWRLLAWGLSLIIFAAHLSYERLRLANPVAKAARHVALAVALGAFILAAVGPVRGHWGDEGLLRTALLSLALWPVLTGVPAFLVALAIGSLVGRAKRQP